MPEVLRAAGLHRALKPEYVGEVTPPVYDARVDPEYKVLNPYSISSYTRLLAERVGSLLDDGRFPLVLGGDCSILLGCALALKRRGSFGLAFVDGHSDLLTPQTSRTGGVAGMDLALITGTGPDLLTNIDGLRPYFRQEDVVQLGCRDYGSIDVTADGRVRGTDILLLGLSDIQNEGLKAIADAAVIRLTAAAERVWIHLDADVLHDSIMPAVDSRQPGGMQYPEMTELITLLLDNCEVAGMNVTIYDPDLDPTGRCGRTLAAALVAIFS
jgi:arginase